MSDNTSDDALLRNELDTVFNAHAEHQFTLVKDKDDAIGELLARLEKAEAEVTRLRQHESKHLRLINEMHNELVDLRSQAAGLKRLAHMLTDDKITYRDAWAPQDDVT